MREIRNELEYKAILSRIDELIEIVTEDTSKEDQNYIELDILTDLVAIYEEGIF